MACAEAKNGFATAAAAGYLCRTVLSAVGPLQYDLVELVQGFLPTLLKQGRELEATIGDTGVDGVGGGGDFLEKFLIDIEAGGSRCSC